MSIPTRRKLLALGSALAILAALLAAAGAAVVGFRPNRTPADRLTVVTSSTLLGSAAAEIGGEHVIVETLIAPGSCPGHYDISPRDTRMISSARLVLTHGYEAFVDRIMESMGRRGPELVKVRINGNWLIPDVYIRGAREVAKALCAADPANSACYTQSLASLESRARQLARRLSRQLAAVNPSGTAVLCSDQQAPFVRWMGFEIARTYARAEEFTPADLRRLNSVAREKKIRLVIDNLQSGPAAGKQLAADIGAAHVTLSNFPGGFPGTDTWDECVEDNVRRVLRSLRQ